MRPAEANRSRTPQIGDVLDAHRAPSRGLLRAASLRYA